MSVDRTTFQTWSIRLLKRVALLGVLVGDSSQLDCKLLLRRVGGDVENLIEILRP